MSSSPFLPFPPSLEIVSVETVDDLKVHVACTKEGCVAKKGGCAGYLGHLFYELDVLRFIERAFLSKHTVGTYNHYGSESIAILSFCLR